MILLSRGRIKNIHDKNDQIFWNELKEDDWKAIEKMVGALTEHKIWKIELLLLQKFLGKPRSTFFNLSSRPALMGATNRCMRR